MDSETSLDSNFLTSTQSTASITKLPSSYSPVHDSNHSASHHGAASDHQFQDLDHESFLQAEEQFLSHVFNVQMSAASPFSTHRHAHPHPHGNQLMTSFSPGGVGSGPGLACAGGTVAAAASSPSPSLTNLWTSLKSEDLLLTSSSHLGHKGLSVHSSPMNLGAMNPRWLSSPTHLPALIPSPKEDSVGRLYSFSPGNPGIAGLASPVLMSTDRNRHGIMDSYYMDMDENDVLMSPERYHQHLAQRSDVIGSNLAPYESSNPHQNHEKSSIVDLYVEEEETGDTSSHQTLNHNDDQELAPVGVMAHGEDFQHDSELRKRVKITVRKSSVQKSTNDPPTALSKQLNEKTAGKLARKRRRDLDVVQVEKKSGTGGAEKAESVIDIVSAHHVLYVNNIGLTYIDKIAKAREASAQRRRLISLKENTGESIPNPTSASCVCTKLHKRIDALLDREATNFRTSQYGKEMEGGDRQEKIFDVGNAAEIVRQAARAFKLKLQAQDKKRNAGKSEQAKRDVRNLSKIGQLMQSRIQGIQNARKSNRSKISPLNDYRRQLVAKMVDEMGGRRVSDRQILNSMCVQDELKQTDEKFANLTDCPKPGRRKLSRRHSLTILEMAGERKYSKLIKHGKVNKAKGCKRFVKSGKNTSDEMDENMIPTGSFSRGQSKRISAPTYSPEDIDLIEQEYLK